MEDWGVNLSVTTLGTLNTVGCLGLAMHSPAAALGFISHSCIQKYTQAQLQSRMSNVVSVPQVLWELSIIPTNFLKIICKPLSLSSDFHSPLQVLHLFLCLSAPSSSWDRLQPSWLFPLSPLPFFKSLSLHFPLNTNYCCPMQRNRILGNSTVPLACFQGLQFTLPRIQHEIWTLILVSLHTKIDPCYIFSSSSTSSEKSFQSTLNHLIIPIP